MPGAAFPTAGAIEPLTSIAITPVSVVPYDSPSRTPNRSQNASATPAGISSPPDTAARRDGSTGTDFAVVAVNIDKGGPEKAVAFLKETGATHLPLYTDPTGKLFATLKAVGMPTTLIVDRQGREIARLVGPADWASPEALAVIEAAIAAPPA